MWIYPEDMTVFSDHASIRQHFPRTSMPTVLTDEVISSLGVLPLVVPPSPSYARATEKLVVTPPELVDSVWTQGWAVVPLTPEEAAQEAVLIQVDIVNDTQARLDDFARTRNYDGILSACTYATSTVPKFKVEGQYCVDQRDATWATLYVILGQVQQGLRPMPNGYDDIKGELPVLEWPQ